MKASMAVPRSSPLRGAGAGASEHTKVHTVLSAGPTKIRADLVGVRRLFVFLLLMASHALTFLFGLNIQSLPLQYHFMTTTTSNSYQRSDDSTSGHRGSAAAAAESPIAAAAPMMSDSKKCWCESAKGKPAADAFIDVVRTNYSSALYHGEQDNNQVLPIDGIYGKAVSVGDVAFGWELMMGPYGLPRNMQRPMGSTWFGTRTLQDPIDAAVLHTLLNEIKPDLILEIGTECGGSAVFLARTMEIHGIDSTVLTFDVNLNLLSTEVTALGGGRAKSRSNPNVTGCENPNHACGTRLLRRCGSDPSGVCPRTDNVGGSGAPSGKCSPLWADLVSKGRIREVIGDIMTRENTQLVRAAAAAAKTVMVIDDGSHLAPHLVSHFEKFADLVTVGSYYLMQDTRLDRVCALKLDNWLDEVLKSPNGTREEFEKKFGGTTCYETAVGVGGPAAALTELQTSSRHFVSGDFKVDRTPEWWTLTQHPGGWLKRVKNTSVLEAK